MLNYWFGWPLVPRLPTRGGILGKKRPLVRARRQQRGNDPSTQPAQSSQPPTITTTTTAKLLVPPILPVEWDIDPITRERLSSNDEEAITIKGNIFHLPTLLNYFHKTTSLNDPVSCTLLTEDEVQGINRHASSLGLETRLSALDDEDSISIRLRQRSQSAEVATLESLIGETVCEMLILVEENSEKSPWVALFTLSDEYETPEFRLALLQQQYNETFQILKLVSLERAYMTLKANENYLRGPLRKLNRDCPKRLLSSSLSFLQSLWSETDQEKLQKLRFPSHDTSSSSS